MLELLLGMNYEQKNGYYVIMTLTFDLTSPISIGFEPVW